MLFNIITLQQVKTSTPALTLQVIGQAIEAYPKDLRINWVRAWPGQTVLCVSQVYWTKDIHDAIQSGQKVKLFPALRLVLLLSAAALALYSSHRAEHLLF